MICSVKIASFPTDNPNGYNNAAVMSDQGQNACLTLSNNGGSPIVIANNWTGGAHQVSAPVAAGTVYVFEWRHEGGVLYLRVNGTGEVLTGAGDTIPIGGFFILGGRFLSVSYSGLIYEAATFNVVPNLATRDALVQSFGTYVGAAV